MGGIEASQAKAEEVKERAKTHLNIFGPSPERQILHDLADYVCRRRF